jgi:hypothetical protein
LVLALLRRRVASKQLETCVRAADAPGELPVLGDPVGDKRF